jgi:hypothetical protein
MKSSSAGSIKKAIGTVDRCLSELDIKRRRLNFKLIDRETGEEIEIGSRRHTIRRRDTFRSSAYITGFDPPSLERAEGCVHYQAQNDDKGATANPSFFEAIIVEDDPEKIRRARLEFIETREWQTFWGIFGPLDEKPSTVALVTYWQGG